MARCIKAAATAESTPPDSPQMASPSPIWARSDSTAASITERVDQSGSVLQACRRKRRIMV